MTTKWTRARGIIYALGLGASALSMNWYRDTGSAPMWSGGACGNLPDPWRRYCVGHHAQRTERTAGSRSSTFSMGPSGAKSDQTTNWMYAITLL